MELADVEDSKSSAGDSVPVRTRPAAPKKRTCNFVLQSAFFLFADLGLRTAFAYKYESLTFCLAFLSG